VICEVCGENEARYAVGDMQEGSNQLWCETCLAGIGLLKAKAILRPEDIAAALGPMLVRPMEEEKPAERPKKGRPRHTVAEVQKQAAEEPVQTPESQPAASDAG
jgi:hypothetical protein